MSSLSILLVCSLAEASQRNSKDYVDLPLLVKKHESFKTQYYFGLLTEHVLCYSLNS